MQSRSESRKTSICERAFTRHIFTTKKFRACKQHNRCNNNNNNPAFLFSPTLHSLTQSPSALPFHSSLINIASTSDRADFFAGIAASGRGSMYGIHGDFGTFSAPYPDPPPPGKSFDTFDYEMSNSYNSSGGEDSSGSPRF